MNPAKLFLSLLLISTFVATGNNLPAQGLNQGKPVVIRLENILDSLINSPDQLLTFTGKTISLGSFSLRKIDRLYPNAQIDSGMLVLNKSLAFRNCTIIGKGLSNLKMKDITFTNCQIKTLSITNIGAVSLSISNSQADGVRVLNSTFKHLHLLHLSNPNPASGSLSVFKTKVTGELRLANNAFYQNIGVFSSELKYLRFEKNQANMTGMGNNLVKNEVLLLDEAAKEFRIRKNEFLSKDTLRHTYDFHGDRLVFINNTVEAPVLFADSRVNNRLEMADNVFHYAVDFHDMTFPEFNKYIPFRQFKQGFVVYQNLYSEESPDGATCFYCELYAGKTDEELADKTNFDKLVQSYEILFLGYKSTGDIESANQAYIQIKELYLNRLGYLYRTHGGFKHYFRWQLAKLLKFYTNHGTDPALSIVISIYVILVFAVFYVFFPSEWDVSSKKRLLTDFKDFINSNEKGYFKPFLTLIVGFGISLINAITLSLNSFVTLGFGTIPTTGVARYVCILQGFIGWFLLSIFTVSLINQILF